jgi:hypothetical protein
LGKPAEADFFSGSRPFAFWLLAHRPSNRAAKRKRQHRANAGCEKSSAIHRVKRELLVGSGKCCADARINKIGRVPLITLHLHGEEGGVWIEKRIYIL